MATTRHENQANHQDNWTETTEGQTPNSITLSVNAKGQAQIEIKLTYATPEAMELSVEQALDRILTEVRTALQQHGIPLAGTVGQEGR